MKTLLIAFISVILIMAMGMTNQPDYAEYDQLVDETEHLTDSARFYLDELAHTNDSLLDIYFPVDEEHNNSKK
jgi:hypothetical protein